MDFTGLARASGSSGDDGRGESRFQEDCFLPGYAAFSECVFRILERGSVGISGVSNCVVDTGESTGEHGNWDKVRGGFLITDREQAANYGTVKT